MNYETPCVEAVIETFGAMCGIAAERQGSAEIIPTPKMIQTDEMLGIIGMTGASKGDIMISMKMEVAKKLVGAFIMEEISEINDELMDGFGEILNIIAGAFAAKVEGIKFQLALPTVMVGQHQTHVREGIKFVSIPMLFPGWGEFKAMILMEET
ncbi:MAG: chemotaxis protein CheX [Victivallales bacterium]|nr:chemotaxis protein CheX [Victivallales bacterium]